MSLESQIAALVSAANSLTSQVAGKITQIDRKVDTATQAVAQKIRSDMDTVIYVDAVNGSDANNGLTEATAKRTVASAILSTPPNSSVEVRLIRGGDHIVNSAIYLKGRKVVVRSFDASYSDPSSFATLRQDLLDGSSLAGGQVMPGYNGFIRFDSVKLETALVPSSQYESGKSVHNYRSSFVSSIDGFGNVIIKDSILNINNLPFMHQHESGAIGMMDLTLVNSDVVRSNQSSAPTSMRRQYLIDRYTSSAVPFSFIVATNVSHNAASWGDLIATDTSLMTTNVTL